MDLLKRAVISAWKPVLTEVDLPAILPPAAQEKSGGKNAAEQSTAWLGDGRDRQIVEQHEVVASLIARGTADVKIRTKSRKIRTSRSGQRARPAEWIGSREGGSEQGIRPGR